MDLVIRAKKGSAASAYGRLAAVLRRFTGRGRAFAKAISRSGTSSTEAHIDPSWARWRCERDVLGANDVNGVMSL
jgi:hypothetical protein